MMNEDLKKSSFNTIQHGTENALVVIQGYCSITVSFKDMTLKKFLQVLHLSIKFRNYIWKLIPSNIIPHDRVKKMMEF